MEKIIYKNEQSVFEARRDFLDIQETVGEFLAEARKCKLEVNDLAQLHGLICNTMAESDLQYLNSIKNEDIPGTSDFKMTKDEFFKTLQLPDRKKLLQLGNQLYSRVGRIELGVLSKDKLEWDQAKFDKYANNFIVKEDSELAEKLLNIAKSVEDFKTYLRELGEKKKMNITLLSNLLPNIGRLLLESGKKIYINPSVYNELKESIR